MYVVISQAIVDIAQYMWNEMIEFKEHSPLIANLPFVAMVTIICAMAEVPFREDKITKPLVGPISLIAGPTPTLGASTSTRPPQPKLMSWKAKIEEFM